MQKIKLNIEIGVKENKEAIEEEVTEFLLSKYFKETNYTGLTYIKIEEKQNTKDMVRRIFNFIGDLLANWYIILGSIAIAFTAAVLDGFIKTDWLYPLGLYASYVFGTCLTYIVLRTLIEALIGWYKKW